jgi:hypothetical protein
MSTILINIISNIFLTLLLILSLTEFSYSLEYFVLDNSKYEIEMIDIGKKIGCKPGYVFTTVIRDTESQKEIWSKTNVEDAKESWIQQGECLVSIYSESLEHLWNRGKFVDFVITTQYCGASCHYSFSIFRFDGHKVTKIKQLSGSDIKIEIDEDQIINVSKIHEGQCTACPNRWNRDIYKWDGNTYKKIKSEETKKASDVPPWKLAK